MNNSFWDDEDTQDEITYVNTTPQQPVVNSEVPQQQTQNNNNGFWDEGDTEDEITMQIPQQPVVPVNNVVQGSVEHKEQYNPNLQPTNTQPNHSVIQGLGNVFNSIKQGAGNLVGAIAQDPVQFAKDTANGLIVNPIKEVVTHPIASSISALEGALKGTVALPQNIQNLVADVQDAYNGTPNASSKWNYIGNWAKNLEGNPLYEHYKHQKALAPTLNALGDFFGAGLGIGSSVGLGVRGASKLSKIGKVANETARISNKLNEAQKLKYANQISKLANKNVEQEIVNNLLAKQAVKPSALRQFATNTTTGAALGSLEGEGLDERTANALQMWLIGGAMTGGHFALNKGMQTRPARKLKVGSKKFIKNVSENPLASQAIAGLDYAFNTDLSKMANDLTRKRKEVYNTNAKNTELSRKISEEQQDVLQLSKDLTDREEQEVFERIKRGDREYAENTEEKQARDFFNEKNMPKTNENVQEDINTPKQEKSSKLSIQQDADLTSDNNLNERKIPKFVREVKQNTNRKNVEEDNVLNNWYKSETEPEIKQETDNTIKSNNKMSMTDYLNSLKEKPVEETINTTEQVETPVAKSKPKRTKQISKKEMLENMKRNTGKVKAEIEPEIIKLEPGAAEGAESSGSFYKKNTDKYENIYENIIHDENSRWKNLSKEDEQKLHNMLKKERYSYLEDPDTNKYILVKADKNGYMKEVTGIELKKIRNKFKKYKQKEIDRQNELSYDERLKAEKETSAEDSKYEYKEDENTLKYQEGISPEVNEVSNTKFIDRVKDDVDFQEFYEKYTDITDHIKELKASEKPNTKTIKQLEQYKNDLLDKAVTKAEKSGKTGSFMENFKRQQEHDAEFGRARKVGDDITDQTGLDNFEDVVKAYKDKNILPEDVKIEGEVVTSKSPNFMKVVDKFETKLPKLRYAKNPFQSLEYRLRTTFKDDVKSQKLYDELIGKITDLETTPFIKEELIKRANEAVDKIDEYSNKLHNDIVNKYGKNDYFDTNKRIKKLEYNGLEEYKKEIKKLEMAVRDGDLPTFYEIINKNGLKGKTSKRVYEIKKQGYEQSADYFYANMEEMGWGVEDGERFYNPVKAKEWAIKEANKKFYNNPKKLAKELSIIEREPQTVKERSLNAFNDLVSKKKNIIRKDVENSYNDKEASVFNRETGKYEKTGTTYNSSIDNLGEGKRKADELMRALTEDEQHRIDRLSKEAKEREISELKQGIENLVNGKDVDLTKLEGKTFDGKEIGKMTSTYKEGSVMGKLLDEVKGDVRLKVNSKQGSSKVVINPDGTYEITIGRNKSVVHEIAHTIFDNFAKTSKLLQKEVARAEQYAKDYLQFRANNLKVLKLINELKNSLNLDGRRTHDISLKDLIAKLPKEAQQIAKSSLEKYNLYKNTMSEQYSDCVKEGIFKGNPLEFKKIYNKIKPGFNKLTKDGKYEGTPEEFRRYFEEQVSQGRTTESGSRNTSRRRTNGLDEQSSEKEQGTGIKRTLYDIDDVIFKTREEFKQATDKIKNITDAVRNLSTDRENFFRKYGTYTDARMKNRLFQQSKYGEGSYFLQARKANDKNYIDWGDKERNQKVGFTGKKVFEGVAKKGDTQYALNRMLQDNVRVKHVDASIELLKKLFGKENKDFVPVNSKLLANTMFFGKSKAFYEAIRKGKDNIAKTFDEENAKEWSELYDTTDAGTSDLWMPKDILDTLITGDKELPADYLKTYGKTRGSKNWFKAKAKQAGALLDFYNDRFKRKVLTSATFFHNNRIGNQMMLMAAAGNPFEYLKGIRDAIRMSDDSIPNEILESTLAENVKNESLNFTKKYWSENQNPIDDLARILNGDRVKLDNIKGLKKLSAIGVNIALSYPNLAFKKLSEFSGEINNKFERFERKQAFSQTLSKMQKDKLIKFSNSVAGTMEMAELAKKNPVLRQAVIDKVGDILGDYNNFTKFEKNVLKRVIPFYAWDRTIIRNAIALGKDNPVKLALIALETYRLAHQDDDFEDYQHGAIKTSLVNNRTNNKLLYNKTKYIPWVTLFELLDSDENIGSITPAITKVGEAIKGEKNFLNGEISSKNYKRINVWEDGEKIQGYLNKKTGEFKEGKAPLPVRAGYLAKDAYEFLYPMSGNSVTKGTVDLFKHKSETGNWLFPDKQYDASLGGYYNNENFARYDGKMQKRYARNTLDFGYQLLNRGVGMGLQVKQMKDRTKKYKDKNKRK